MVGQLQLKLADKQAILEIDSPSKRLSRLYELIKAEIEILQVERKIRTRVKKQMEKTQKEYYLNEQMQAIQKELGDRDEFKNELTELEERAKQKNLSKEAQGKVKKELKKLRMMAPMSAEAAVVRNYVDWVLGLPWGEKTDEKLDVVDAERILDEDHYGLKKVKERILEYLAVQALVKKLKGPILCLVGPPGVGKTSLARSIAKATGRNFVRLSLGGVRDEAEIRGHRRTYIGALPGKIIQSIKKAGTQNPVFLLDEIDKMSTDFRGDPSAALLEVLDPEQNSTFNDHYLDLDYDLSDVMFITTANYLHGIPIPLQDRMEIIQLPGYTEFEKVSIAERYLIPKQKRDNGIADVPVEFPEESVRDVIHYYTKEAGVRNLERELATVCRKIARAVVAKKAPVHMLDDGPTVGWRITPKRLTRYLGPHRFRYGRQEGEDEIGLVMGLAVTMHGGELLATEVSIVSGKGKLVLTGKLGDVMQESAQAAISYVRARAPSLGLDRDFYSRADIHVHLPEGAIPKDGPSAGITMCTGLVSALLRVPVRRDLAMTGEITLRGRVLPIGGLKEKILAAHRSGITTVIMPKENAKDLRDIPKRVLKTLKVIPVDHMDEVLRHALVLPDPASFLTSPSVTVDWRQPLDRRDDRRDKERRDENSRMPVASAVPPPSAVEEPEPHGEPRGDGHQPPPQPGATDNPGSSPDTSARPFAVAEAARARVRRRRLRARRSLARRLLAQGRGALPVERLHRLLRQHDDGEDAERGAEREPEAVHDRHADGEEAVLLRPQPARRAEVQHASPRDERGAEPVHPPHRREQLRRRRRGGPLPDVRIGHHPAEQGVVPVNHQQAESGQPDANVMEHREDLDLLEIRPASLRVPRQRVIHGHNDSPARVRCWQNAVP